LTGLQADFSTEFFNRDFSRETMESKSPRDWRPARASAGTRSGAPTRREEFPPLPPQLRLGDKLGEYRLVREIWSSGSSAVFAAARETDERSVALKVLSSHLSLQSVAVMRFRAEAALAARVTHGAIVSVLGSGRSRDHDYYAMRLESGATLADLSASPLCDEARFADLALRFAVLIGGVAQLHRHGIVHRDIKPSNVLLDAEGCLVLADFGSALDRHSPEPLLEECLGGTVLYMSPEQLSPGADPYDPAGDVYSLGATLYEVCAGNPPFPEELSDADLARLKVTRLPPAPRHWNHRIPLGLEGIIRQAIDADPSRRYASAEAMAWDLVRFSSRKRGSVRGTARANY
jgi:serine/threonine protein kinase